MWECNKKKNGIIVYLLAFVLLLGMGALVSCGYKPQENSSNAETESRNAAGEENKSDEAMVRDEGVAAAEEEDASEDYFAGNEEVSSQPIYEAEEYGNIQTSREEAADDNSKELLYYYEMEEFYLRDDYPNAAKINETLRGVYNGYRESYEEDLGNASEQIDGGGVPYDYLHMLEITYIGEDYISLRYNDVTYFGGAHPYSKFDGITIDCKTGKEVTASELLGSADDEILTYIKEAMGMDVVPTWDDVDFYLTESSLVFFYRQPNYWDDVVINQN